MCYTKFCEIYQTLNFTLIKNTLKGLGENFNVWFPDNYYKKIDYGTTSPVGYGYSNIINYS